QRFAVGPVLQSRPPWRVDGGAVPTALIGSPTMPLTPAATYLLFVHQGAPLTRNRLCAHRARRGWGSQQQSCLYKQTGKTQGRLKSTRTAGRWPGAGLRGVRL